MKNIKKFKPATGEVYGPWKVLDGKPIGYARIGDSDMHTSILRCVCIRCGRVAEKRSNCLEAWIYRGKKRDVSGCNKCKNLGVPLVGKKIETNTALVGTCRSARSRKREHLKRMFKMSLEQYEFILEKQNFRCAICQTHISETTRAFAVDHCHETKRIRGLLCFSCNIGIGYFKEDFDRLKAAMCYLEQQPSIVPDLQVSRDV